MAGTRGGQERVPQGSSPLNLPGSLILNFSRCEPRLGLAAFATGDCSFKRGCADSLLSHAGCIQPPREAPVPIATKDANLLP